LLVNDILKLMRVVKYILLIISVVFVSLSSTAQKKMTRSQYIEKYKEVAINNMRKHKIPASITLAQGVLESGDGNSELARKSNNHFGIKCHSDWKGKKTYHDDDKKQECFRVYKTVYDSYADHANFLHKKRYAKCFELKITDYKGWAKELKNAGYATSSKYPKLLIKIIEDYQLYKYDKIALGKGEIETPVATGPNENYDKNDDFAEIEMSDKPMVKLSGNRIKFIRASKGDTPESIAKKLEMGSWQIKNYNDVKGSYRFEEGETVYLQPKKSKSSKKSHTVKSGDTIWSVSQKYGVKMSKIYKYNGLKKGDELKPGQKVLLRKK